MRYGMVRWLHKIRKCCLEKIKNTVQYCKLEARKGGKEGKIEMDKVVLIRS